MGKTITGVLVIAYYWLFCEPFLPTRKIINSSNNIFQKLHDVFANENFAQAEVPETSNELMHLLQP